MICVYGFTEFVEAIVAQRDSGPFAENSYDERPLEVAALYGNYEVMVRIYTAACAKRRKSSPIRQELWLRAASKNYDLKIWNFAVERLPD